MAVWLMLGSFAVRVRRSVIYRETKIACKPAGTKRAQGLGSVQPDKTAAKGSTQGRRCLMPACILSAGAF